MELDKWVGPCKVRAFPWVDGKSIYVNVQYFKPGQSMHQEPAWDRTAYIFDNEAGRRMVFEYTSTMVDAFMTGKIKHNYHITVE